MDTRNKDRGLFEKHKGSGIWWICYFDRAGHKHREQAGPKEYARILYARRKAECLIGGKMPDLARRRVPFGELAEDALEWASTRHRSFGTDRGRMKMLLAWWKDLEAEALTAQEIERKLNTLEAKRGGPASGATVNRYRSLISLVYRLAQKHERIRQGTNPARLVDMREEAKRVRWLSTEEERRLRMAVSERCPQHLPEIDLALNLGLRRADQYGLSLEQNGAAGRLSITAGKNRVPLLLPVNQLAANAIHELAATNGPGLHSTKKPRHWFECACKFAGIRDFHWHDLRHTFATRLLEAGVPAEKVQQLLGHRSITMTLRYAHLVGKYQDDAMAKLEEINRNIASGGGAVVRLETAREESCGHK